MGKEVICRPRNHQSPVKACVINGGAGRTQTADLELRERSRVTTLRREENQRLFGARFAQATTFAKASR